MRAPPTRPHAPRARLALILVLLCLAPAAQAHANLQASDPAIGARLDAAPQEVRLTFTESVDAAGSQIAVLDAADARVDTGDLSTSGGDHPEFRLALQAHLPDGAYRIQWRVLSGTDGHATSGTVGFAVGHFEPPASLAQDPGHLDGWVALARSVSYAGFALAFAATAFLAYVAPDAAAMGRRTLLWGATAHLAGALALTHFTLGNVGLGWSDVGSSDVGRVLLLRILLGVAAWTAALLAFLRRHNLGAWTAALLLGGAGILSARLAHGSAGGPALVAIDFLHLAAAATWVGGLGMLLWRLPKDPDPRRLGARFGTVAMVCVGVLWAAGTVVGLGILGRGALTATAWSSVYGRVLLTKVVLAALMLLLAAVNRYVALEPERSHGPVAALQRTARRATRGHLRPWDPARPNALRDLVATEATLGLTVLVLAGILTSISPPAAPGAIPVVLVGQTDTYLVHAILSPAPHVGSTSTLVLQVDGNDGSRLGNNTCGNSACLQVAIDYGGSPESHVAAPDGTGTWVVRDLLWSRAGDANLTVTLSSAEVFREQVQIAFQVS